jgi:hypothetical protein
MQRLFWILPVLLISPAVLAQSLSDQAPAPITTDTPAYCAELARQMAQEPDPPRMAQSLLREGKFLCDEGQIRGGLARLRRALMLTREQRNRTGEP